MNTIVQAKRKPSEGESQNKSAVINVVGIKTGYVRMSEYLTGEMKKTVIVFHDTRHCFNTNMRKSGVPESVIPMKITGHSTRELFVRYDSVDETDTRKAVDQIYLTPDLHP